MTGDAAAEAVRARLLSDDRDRTPLYFRLKTVLVDALRSLEYAPGARLPNERRLAEMYGVSRITVRQALDLMVREGLLRRSRGRHGGTFVCEGPRTEAPLAGSFESLFSTRQVRRIEILALDRRQANAAVAAELRVAPGSTVVHVERRLIGTAGPIAHVRVFLPLAIGARLRRRDLRRRLLQDILLDSAEVKASELHDEITACLADTVSARMLEVDVGRPLLLVRRSLIAPGDEPIYTSAILIASDRFTMTLRQSCSR